MLETFIVLNEKDMQKEQGKEETLIAQKGKNGRGNGGEMTYPLLFLFFFFLRSKILWVAS